MVYLPSMPERGQHAEPRPSAAHRAPAAGLEAGAIAGQSKRRPQRQQHHVVVELRREDREVDHALLRQHGQQRALLPQHRAAEPPHREQRQCRGQRPHQVQRGRPAAGDGGDGFHDPRRQRRMLEIDDLPLAAPGELLDHVERQVVLQQRRQQPPDQDVEGRKPSDRLRAGAMRRRRADGPRCVQALPPPPLPESGTRRSIRTEFRRPDRRPSAHPRTGRRRAQPRRGRRALRRRTLAIAAALTRAAAFTAAARIQHASARP